MRATLLATLICALALASLSAPLLAQNGVPDPSELDNSSHYVPPSARQSVEIGNFYFRRKDYRGALSRFEEAARDDPYYAPAYLGLGKVYEKTGKKRDALAAYRKYLNVLPSQKQADEATAVHKDIRRLEKELGEKQAHSSAAKGKASASAKR
jgi:tetratricopeptide (TPR) repeat protein